MTPPMLRTRKNVRLGSKPYTVKIAVDQRIPGKSIRGTSTVEAYVLFKAPHLQRADCAAQIEAQRYKWKDCYCINPDPDRGPCTFDNRAEETCEDDTHEEVSNSPGKNEDTEEISVDGQQNVLDASDNEDCPRGVDTLDCEDCGGPEQTWDRIHCKGVRNVCTPSCSQS